MQLFSAFEPGADVVGPLPLCVTFVCGTNGSQAAGTLLTGWPVALTPSLEMIQAPGWPGTVVAVNASPGLARRLTFAPAAAIVATVWLVGNRFGRTSGVVNWAAAKMARVMAMAGTARRTSRPAGPPSAEPNPAQPSRGMAGGGKTDTPKPASLKFRPAPPRPAALPMVAPHPRRTGSVRRLPARSRTPPAPRPR